MPFTKDQFKSIFFSQPFLHTISFAILLLSIACFYSNFTDFNFDSTFNSDSIGVPYLFKDLLHDGGHFKNWYLASAPTLFPDLTLYYLLFLIFKLDFLTITFLFGVIQVASIVALSCFIFRKLIKGKMRDYSWLVPLFYSFIFFESYYFAKDQILPFLFLIYSYHTGTLLNTLISFSIIVTDLKFGFKIFFIFLMAALAMYSDMLYLVMFATPIIGLNIIQCRFNGLAKSLLIIFSVLVGCGFGYYLFNLLNVSSAVHNTYVSNLFSFENIFSSFQVMWKQVYYDMRREDFQAILTIVTCITPPLALIVLLVFRRKIDASLKYFFWFYILFAVSTLSAPVLIGAYHTTDCIRYVGAVYFFSTVMMAFGVSFILAQKIKGDYTKKILSYLILCVFFYLAFAKFKPDGFTNYFSYYPPKVRALDSICVKHQFKKGISDYWKAKWSSMFSRSGITVVSVYKTINFYETGSNFEWFYTGEFDFVIPDHLDTLQIRKNFVILDTISTPEITILHVKKFIYPRGQFFPKTIDTLISK